MRSRTIVAALVVLQCGAALASAQVLSLEFHDGRVKLTAENVPVSQILAEWTRVGGTTIVNGERVPGAPVTLQLDAPERQALDTVLRGAAGYMVLGRETSSTGASEFDRILVLPTTARAPAAAAVSQPAPQPQLFQRPEPELNELDESIDNQGPPPPANFPRGRVPLNLPNGAVQVPRENEGPPLPPEPEPAPGNPFGIVPGPNRPGTISAPPPQDPNAQQITR